VYEEQKKDFIDKVNEATLKRTQAFSGSAYGQPS